jgi:hypothetical protein
MFPQQSVAYMDANIKAVFANTRFVSVRYTWHTSLRLVCTNLPYTMETPVVFAPNFYVTCEVGVFRHKFLAPNQLYLFVRLKGDSEFVRLDINTRVVLRQIEHAIGPLIS